MSMTQTLAIPALARPEPKSHVHCKDPPPWFDPTVSVNKSQPVQITKSIREVLGQTKCWYAKGPVLAAFLSIEEDLINCLDVHDNDLQAGERVCGMSYKLQPYMLGGRPSSARPCIAMSCSSKIVCQRAVEIIKSSSWWLDFDKKYPGFRFVYFRPDSPPVRLGGRDEVESDQDEMVFVRQGITSLYNASILLAQPTGGAGIQIATLGGIVFLDGKPYGLTVAHCFSQQQRGEVTSPVDVADSGNQPAFCFLDEDDSISGTTSESGSTLDKYDAVDDTDHVSDHSDSSVRETWNTTFHRSQAAYPTVPGTNVDVLGRIIHRSTGDANDMVDWALISFEPKWSTLLLNRDRSPDVSTKVLPLLVTHRSQTLSRPCLIRDDKVRTGHDFIGAAYIRLPNATRPIKVHEVDFRDLKFNYGDCGRWVYNNSTKTWIGHIVAGHPGCSTAYISSSVDIQKQIAEATGGRVQLPCDILNEETWSYPDYHNALRLIVERLTSTTVPNEVDPPEVRSQSPSTNTKKMFEKEWHQVQVNSQKIIDLCNAARDGETLQVYNVLEQGVALNAEVEPHGTALHAASRNGHLVIMKLLLNAGADCDKKHGHYGTALQEACVRGNKPVVEVLLDAGADVNVQCGNFGTALQAASYGGHSHIVEMLLSHGADINSVGGKYGTALGAAKSAGWHGIFVRLIAAGASDHVDHESGREDSVSRPSSTSAEQSAFQQPRSIITQRRKRRVQAESLENQSMFLDSKRPKHESKTPLTALQSTILALFHDTKSRTSSTEDKTNDENADISTTDQQFGDIFAPQRFLKIRSAQASILQEEDSEHAKAESNPHPDVKIKADDNNLPCDDIHAV